MSTTTPKVHFKKHPITERKNLLHAKDNSDEKTLTTQIRTSDWPLLPWQLQPRLMGNVVFM